MKINTKPRPMVAAIATMVGSTVGIGIFGIPYVFAKAGFGLGFLFLLVIGSVTVFANLLFGEVVLRTHKRHQFVGYVKKYLGRRAHMLNTFKFWIAVFGSVTAVLIINGEFLTVVLTYIGISITPVVASTIFVIIASVLIFFGLKTVSKLDVFMMMLFFTVVIIIGITGASSVQMSNFSLANSKYWFLPFGVILFSLISTFGVPLAREVLVGKEEKLKKAIIIGTCIPIVLYLIFTFFVVGISGESTSVDSISGLRVFLGPNIILLGALFGFLTSTTIFLTMAVSFKESMWQDFGLHKKYGFLFLIVPPYIMFLLGVRNFINIIGLVGGVAGSIDLILMMMVYVKAKQSGNRLPEYTMSVPKWALFGIVGFFFVGAAYSLIF